MNQEQVWDKISASWNEYKRIQYPDYLEFIRGKKGKILDLGCGSGRNFVKNKNLKFYGVDFSENMLKYAEIKAKKLRIKVKLEKSKTDKLLFPDNFFDAAIFIATLHCIDDEEKREKSLQELFRVLKKGAEAMITVWSRNNKRVKNKPKESMIPWTVESKKYYRYYYLYGKEELEKLLKKVGFKILKSWEDDNIIAIVQKPKDL